VAEQQNIGSDLPAAKPARHGAVAAVCVSLVVGMGALSYAAVPLYKMFCQVTGFGGTTQRVEKPSSGVIDRMITVRFDANVSPALPWKFEPVQRTVTARIGENVLAFYTATNTSDRVIKGTAAFNVSPDPAGKHFNKIECFCFKEQTLQPGETVEMPLSFYVDPKLVDDRDAAWVQEITLSYTFYPSAEPGQGS
jgi:cytochrome c oxidase assembly protein subunit 11